MRGDGVVSRRHYKWWGYIKTIIQEYPKVQPSDLSGVALREHEAVKKAVGDTLKLDGGTNRMSVISMVHWKQTHTLEGAALAVPCSRRTAAYWQKEFFERSARNMGLLD